VTRVISPAGVAALRCPVCGARLALDGRTVRCAAGHSFDVARQGYVNLLPGDARPGTADTPEMVAARVAFLDRGWYAGIAGAVASALPGGDGALVDLGAGTGYYLAAALRASPGRVGLALDISRAAVRRAARAHPDVTAVVCDAWRSLPVGDGVAAAVLSVFAPRNPPEIARILRPDGVFVVVTPASRHLAEIVSALGLLEVHGDKPRRLAEQLSGRFVTVGEEAVEFVMPLQHADIATLVGMGPSAWHVDGEEIGRRVGRLPAEVEVTASVRVTTYRQLAAPPAPPPSDHARMVGPPGSEDQPFVPDQ
jgi:23S rRNA (guanine745-N1)-methyltransferase